MKLLKICLGIILTLGMFSCDTDDDTEGTPPIIDLEASEISFAIANQENFVADATITGTITNIEETFSSGMGQQAILLYERSLGTPAGNPGVEVARVDFTNLAAGQTLSISYTRSWDASSPAEGEFPPDYRLVLSYDPDLFIDGNENNDDTNSSNDTLERNGQGINQLFN